MTACRYMQASWLSNSSVVTLGSLGALVAQFAGAAAGAVVYDTAVPATSNVASTAAGAMSLLPFACVRARMRVRSGVAHSACAHPECMRRVAEGAGTGRHRARSTRSSSRPDSCHRHGHTGVRECICVFVLVVMPQRLSLVGRFNGSETGSAKCDAYMWAIREYINTGLSSNSIMGGGASGSSAAPAAAHGERTRAATAGFVRVRTLVCARACRLLRGLLGGPEPRRRQR